MTLLQSIRRNISAIGIAAILLCVCAATVFPDGSNDDKKNKKKSAKLQERIEKSLVQLDNDEWKVREEAMYGLVKIGEPAIPALKEAMWSKSLEVRWRAETALKMIEMHVSRALKKKIGQLLDNYAKKEWHERGEVVQQLVAIGGKEALPVLRRIARKEKHPAVLKLVQEMLVKAELSTDEGKIFLLVDQGIALMERKKYEQAIKSFRQVLEIDPQYNLAYYNIACAYSIMGEKEQALDYLAKAVELGFDNIDHMKKDPDLDNIRDDERFRELMERSKIEILPPKESGATEKLEP